MWPGGGGGEQIKGYYYKKMCGSFAKGESLRKVPLYRQNLLASGNHLNLNPTSLQVHFQFSSVFTLQDFSRL